MSEVDTIKGACGHDSSRPIRKVGKTMVDFHGNQR